MGSNVLPDEDRVDGFGKMILHIAPGHVDVRPGQGSHKDVAARRAFLAADGLDYSYVNVSGDEPSQLADTLGRCTPSHVLIEYSYFPRIAKEIRRRCPDAFIAVRAHNIEPLQEWTLTEPRTLLEHLRSVYAFFRLLIADARVARIADHVFVISPVEAHRYWRWLGIGARVSWLPYIPPAALRQSARGGSRNVIACLPGGLESRRTRDLVNRFTAFAQAAKDAGWSERFVITGELAGWDVKLNAAVELAGYVDDLTSFYKDVKAVAVLSPVGYGFKTTIADAVWNGAMVLVHPTIGSTLPEELTSQFVMLDALTPSALARAKSSLCSQILGWSATDALKRRFDQEMGRFLAGNAVINAVAIDRLRE